MTTPTEPGSNTPPDDVLDLLAGIVNDPATDEPEVAPAEIRRVVAAYLAVTAGGAPAGTVMRTPAGGMAIRVADPTRGPLWMVNEPEGDGTWTQSMDRRPTLPSPWELT